MKREQPPKHRGDPISLIKIWNFFTWNSCVVCKFDFRREWGWRHTTHSFRAKWRYVCCGCCPTKDHASDAVKKEVKDEHARMIASAPRGGSGVRRPPPPPIPEPGI